MLSSKVESVIPRDGGALGVSIKTSKGETLDETFDKILLSVGRKPNTDLLKLENTDIDIIKQYKCKKS